MTINITLKDYGYSDKELFDRNKVSYTDLSAQMGNALRISGNFDSNLIGPIKLAPFMARLLLDKSYKFPNYKFIVHLGNVLTVSGSDDSQPRVSYATVVAVHCDGERIGQLHMPYYENKMRLSAHSMLSSKKDHRATGDYSRASKIFDEFFTPKTVMQLYAHGRRRLGSLCSDLIAENEKLKTETAKFFFDTLVRNLSGDMERLKELCGDVDTESAFMKMQQIEVYEGLNGPYTIVHLHQGNCVVCTPSTGRNEFLEEHIKAGSFPQVLSEKLGKLKLAGPNALVRDTGMMHDENTYLILGDYK
jgi:hypothetical protein